MANILSNSDLVQELKEVLAAMKIREANRFRIMAYENAISSIETSTYSVYDLWKKDRLQEIEGIGPSLAQHISDLFEKGRVEEFEVLKRDLPEGMFSLIGIQGIGPKRAYKLSQELGLENRETALEELAEAAEKGEIRDISGFGEKSEASILQAIQEAKKTKSEKDRILWVHADAVVQRVYSYMRTCKDLKDIVALGSYRRGKETIGDLDIAASTLEEKSVMEYFLNFGEIREVLAEGEKKVSVVLGTDLQVDFRTSLPSRYGSMIQYFTGSKYHNIVLRTYALEKGYSLSEYGIKKDNKLHEFADEESFYGFIDLPLIPPEIRQGKEEVDLAAKGSLPNLLTVDDIKGELHSHTDFSDGLDTMEAMVEAASERGYSYFGISDHAPSVTSRGYKEVKKIIDDQIAQVRKLDKKYPDMKILFGYEVNILADASLSLPDDFLEKLDFVIASIHTSLDQDRVQIMKRLRKALKHPLVDIIGHPSGRLLGERDSLDIDWSSFLEEVLKNNKILEINSQPHRLDLPYDLVKEAKDKGIRLIINSDAHSVDTLYYIEHGVCVARRGWCEKGDVLNTLRLEDFLGELGIN